MTATTTTTGIAIYRGEPHWCLNSCINRVRLLYLVPKKSDQKPDFCVGGEWVPASEVERWVARDGGRTVSLRDA
jgi:hypothetical protein